MSAERIHINEAVRTYNKTRQTFYNWIRKGYLKAQKKNNKVYIATDDIEQLLSDYIGEQFEEKTESQELITTNEHNYEDDTMFYELITELQLQKQLMTQKVDEQKTGLLHEINLTKQELRTDIQRAAEGVQQQQYIATKQRERKLITTQKKITLLTSHLNLANKRNSFWVGFLVFVLANITLLTLLNQS